MRLTGLFTLLLFLIIAMDLTGQSNIVPEEEKKDSTYEAMKWRNIGPFRGGRSTTSTGIIGDPMIYYFGSVGGGVWKTEDAGLNWKNVSDGFIDAGSIGAISVASSDANVIYVGTGEACIRGVMTSHGDGLYKSTDAGKTWKHIGLEKTLQISEIRIHPENPDIVYVAAQGSPYAPTKDRGIYKTTDGGKTWSKSLFIDENSGANNLSMDMNNPRILYAAFWDHDRDPWYVRSGGPGSGIWKTTDGGETWKKLTKGLPHTTMGKAGVSVSPANSNIVFAVMEAEKSGLYKSTDAGESWSLVNQERILITRSWYYIHVFADPINENLVYVLNAPFMKSIDGGKTFTRVQVPHGDNHDLWINPDNPKNMISSDDGGATITFNGGKSWTNQKNQSTAQFYRVSVDNRFPYWVYGGQQDNSTVAIPSRTDGGGIGWQDWVANVGGGEAAHIAFDPDDPKYIYSSNITGMIDEYTWDTKKQKFIKPYPIFDLGEPSDEMKYRYNWNPPVIVSQHNPKVLFYGSQVIHKSEDRGNSWVEISDDLTRNNPENLGLMGGPYTNEAAGAETYHTLMTLAESPHDAQTLYAGADDGMVHITRDGGASWTDITPGPEGIINSIEVSSHDSGTVYLTLMRYKLDDYKAYMYKSTDYGKNWQNISSGIPDHAFARVLREDPNRKALLYAGTERGIFISYNDGQKWEKWQLNLPVVPITDMQVHQNDLVVATHGRGFWILDDLSPLKEINSEVLASDSYLYSPRNAIQTGGSVFPSSNPLVGKNPFGGISIKYQLSETSASDSTEIQFEILDEAGNLIRTFATNAEIKANKLKKHGGMNEVKWDYRAEQIKVSKNVMMPPGQKYKAAHKMPPGNYSVQMIHGVDTTSRSFKILEDPRDGLSEEDRKEKTVLLYEMYEEIKDIYQTIDDVQEIRDQINSLIKRINDDDKIGEMGKKISTRVDSMESQVISPKQKTFQDIINFRNRVDFQLYTIYSTIDANNPPITKGEKELYQELNSEWQQHKGEIQKILEEEVPAFNKMLKEKGIPFIAPMKSLVRKKDGV